MTANHTVRLIGVLLTATCLLMATGCGDSAARREKAEAQVRRIAADLDKKTTESGSYVRVKEGDIMESDPWGTRVQVSYEQGGVAEVVSVRSAGADREFHTDDDLVALGVAANLKGIGEGIKANTEEVAAKAAKGLVKGTVEGVKEAFKRNNAREGDLQNEPTP
jgi:hypothetical protein